MNATFVYNVEYEFQARNFLPTTNLEQGLVIDNGVPMHINPLKKNCYQIQNANRRMYCADGSSVIWKHSRSITIQINSNKKNLGILKPDDVLIVPNLGRKLFSVRVFLSEENNWVHFEKNRIDLGFYEEPRVRLLLFYQIILLLITATKNKSHDIQNQQHQNQECV